MFVLIYKKKNTYFNRIKKTIQLNDKVGLINNSGWEIIAILKYNYSDKKLYSINNYLTDIYKNTKKVSKWVEIIKILFNK